MEINEVEKFFEAEANQLEFDPSIEGRIRMEIKIPKNFLEKEGPQRNRKFTDEFDLAQNFHFSNRQFLIGNFSLQRAENQILVEHFNRLIFTFFYDTGNKILPEIYSINMTEKLHTNYKL